MSSANNVQILDQAIKPHLETDEGIDFLTGQATMDDIRVSSQSITPYPHITSLGSIMPSTQPS